MDETTLAYENLLKRFVEWATPRNDLRAAMILGSRARTDHPADRWSDLDIVLFVDNMDPYLVEDEWLTKLGKPMIAFVEATADGRSKERRVLFDNGLDVDFALLPMGVLSLMMQDSVPADLLPHLKRGMRIIIDKDGFLAQLQQKIDDLPNIPPPAAPKMVEFSNLVNDFWYHAMWTAKHLRRGELWWAKGSIDGHMKQLLQRMMEWHARATQGGDHDIWFRGRFLEEWVAPQAKSALPHLFAHYDEDDIWRALSATMSVFRMLATEAAEKFGYSYAVDGDQFATELVRQLDAERTQQEEADAL